MQQDLENTLCSAMIEILIAFKNIKSVCGMFDFVWKAEFILYLLLSVLSGRLIQFGIMTSQVVMDNIGLAHQDTFDCFGLPSLKCGFIWFG